MVSVVTKKLWPWAAFSLISISTGFDLKKIREVDQKKEKKKRRDWTYKSNCSMFNLKMILVLDKRGVKGQHKDSKSCPSKDHGTTTLCPMDKLLKDKNTQYTN